MGKLGSDKTPQLNGTIMLIPNSERSAGTEEAPPIQMHWKVPMASVSGKQWFLYGAESCWLAYCDVMQYDVWTALLHNSAIGEKNL